jgi:hypothetical protein
LAFRPVVVLAQFLPRLVVILDDVELFGLFHFFEEIRTQMALVFGLGHVNRLLMVGARGEEHLGLIPVAVLSLLPRPFFGGQTNGQLLDLDWFEVIGDVDLDSPDVGGLRVDQDDLI